MMTINSYTFQRVSVWGDWILPTLKQVKKWLTTNRTNSISPGGAGQCRCGI